mmetsp:Transcript_17289/g.48707  ORF Transcript_17289/g.48707 Transcript_17289/m.48707 type:complete len:282 (+) Transcript_17289:377-1222(+)
MIFRIPEKPCSHQRNRNQVIVFHRHLWQQRNSIEYRLASSVFQVVRGEQADRSDLGRIAPVHQHGAVADLASFVAGAEDEYVGYANGLVRPATSMRMFDRIDCCLHDGLQTPIILLHGFDETLERQKHFPSTAGDVIGRQQHRHPTRVEMMVAASNGPLLEHGRYAFVTELLQYLKFPCQLLRTPLRHPNVHNIRHEQRLLALHDRGDVRDRVRIIRQLIHGQVHRILVCIALGGALDGTERAAPIRREIVPVLHGVQKVAEQRESCGQPASFWFCGGCCS